MILKFTEKYKRPERVKTTLKKNIFGRLKLYYFKFYSVSVAQVVKNLPAAQQAWFNPWQPTPEFFPGKSYGQRRLVDYSLWSCRVGHV